MLLLGFMLPKAANEMEMLLNFGGTFTAERTFAAKFIRTLQWHF